MKRTTTPRTPPARRSVDTSMNTPMRPAANVSIGKADMTSAAKGRRVMSYSPGPTGAYDPAFVKPRSK